LYELGQRRARWEVAHQRALEAAGEALVAVAQAWATPGWDLAGHLEAAQRAWTQIDHHTREATRAADSRKQEFAALCRAADEERSRNTQLGAQLRVTEERLTRTRARYSALEARLRAPQRAAATGAQAAHKATAASAARPAVLRELDDLRNELAFLAREQARQREQLGAHDATMSQLHDQQVRLLDLAEREAAHHRALADAARSAHRAALAGLARTGQRAGLLARVPRAQRAVRRTEAQLEAHQRHEARLRVVLGSYDANANRRGIVALFVAGLVTVSVAITAVSMLRAL
jgi:chromosome segregation ATPase